MLRQLAAFCRPLAQQHSLHLVSQSSTAVAVQSKRSFQCTSGAHGLEEFFEAPLAEAEKPRTGNRLIDTTPPNLDQQPCIAMTNGKACCKCRQRLEGSRPQTEVLG